MDEAANNPSFEDKTEFDCHRLVRRINGHKVLLAGCVGLFLLAGLAYLVVVPELYQATTIIEVHGHGANTADRGREEVGEMRLKTVEQSLRRISIYRRVVAREDFREALFSGEPDEVGLQRAAERLAGRTQVRWQRGTNLVFLTVADENPEIAGHLAGALVKEFIGDQVARGREGIEYRLDLLSQASKSLRKQIREDQEMEATIHGLGPGVDQTKPKLEVHEKEAAGLGQGKVKGASGLKLLELLAKKGGKFWDELDLNQLSGLTEEKRSDVILKYVRARADVLGMEIATERQLLASLVDEIKQLGFLAEIEEPGIRVVEPAFVLPGTAGPGRGLILIVSIFLGLAMGLLLIWCKGVCWSDANPGGK